MVFKITLVFILQSKKKFERECREAEKAQQTFEKMDNDTNATKSDVEKVNHTVVVALVNTGSFI